MDDPGSSWPAWKFGMKRDELFTKLHDQYNTFPSSIQDPEAFHHDVYEISNTASTTAEFHHLLADRKDQRLRELNNSLESASLEIIANPKLIGTEQWQHALQLFRTKSLDSLVRYFASYLPEDHSWHHRLGQTSTSTSFSADSTYSSDDSTTSEKLFFDEEDHDVLTHEPLSIVTFIPTQHLPPSPRSLTMCSNSSSASPIDDVHHHEYMLNTLTPARTLSFSEPEMDLVIHSGTSSRPDHEYDYQTSQTDDADEVDTPTTSISDISDTQSLPETRHQCEEYNEPITPAECEGSAEQDAESDTPTPRIESPSNTQRHACETSTWSKLSLQHQPSSLHTHVLNKYVRTSRSRRDGSPGRSARRSPEVGRVHKSLPDSTRLRSKGSARKS